MSVVTQSQLALAQQWYARVQAQNEAWSWQIGDWACLAQESPEERDMYLVEYVWEGLLEVRPAAAAPTHLPQRQPAERFFPLPSWERGRAWLRSHGWGLPYCATDGVTITWFFEPYHTDLDELLSAQGTTDLECLYTVMLQAIERQGRLGHQC